jgi:hypothetical protein
MAKAVRDAIAQSGQVEVRKITTRIAEGVKRSILTPADRRDR